MIRNLALAAIGFAGGLMLIPIAVTFSFIGCSNNGIYSQRDNENVVYLDERAGGSCVINAELTRSVEEMREDFEYCIGVHTALRRIDDISHPTIENNYEFVGPRPTDLSTFINTTQEN